MRGVGAGGSHGLPQLFPSFALPLRGHTDGPRDPGPGPAGASCLPGRPCEHQLQLDATLVALGVAREPSLATRHGVATCACLNLTLHQHPLALRGRAGRSAPADSLSRLCVSRMTALGPGWPAGCDFLAGRRETSNLPMASEGRSREEALTEAAKGTGYYLYRNQDFRRPAPSRWLVSKRART